MKKLFLLALSFALLFLCSASVAYAQVIGSPFSSMFSELELVRVPTGYLIDVAVERADLHKYNGTLSSDNYSDAAVFWNVQTLTAEDMVSLKITEDEKSYGNAYLVLLNELNKQE